MYNQIAGLSACRWAEGADAWTRASAELVIVDLARILDCTYAAWNMGLEAVCSAGMTMGEFKTMMERRTDRMADAR